MDTGFGTAFALDRSFTALPSLEVPARRVNTKLNTMERVLDSGNRDAVEPWPGRDFPPVCCSRLAKGGGAVPVGDCNAGPDDGRLAGHKAAVFDDIAAVKDPLF